MRKIKIKPCHGTVEREMVNQRVTEIKKIRGEPLGPMDYDFIGQAQDDVTAMHKARIAKAPTRDERRAPDCHPYHCECHWCCHDEEFDDNPEDCPACQEDLWILKASADWSECYLVSDNVSGIIDTIKCDLEAMLDHPEDGGVISITVEKKTHLEWNTFLLKELEFEGFQ